MLKLGDLMNLYRAFATVGGLTLISRLLGFVRDVLFAAVFGSGMVADAFNVAFRFPNLFRRLFGEGAFNSAFVPLFAQTLERDGREAARQFAEETMAWLVVVLVILSAACMIGMPWLMYLLAPGFSENPEKFDLAVQLTQITFPYLLCMSLVALLSGVLNTFQRFVESSSISIILNTVLTIGLLVGFALGCGNDANGGLVQAIAVTVAGLLQLAHLAWGVRRIGFGLRLRRPRMTEGTRQLIARGIPGVVASGVTQLNIMIGTMIASLEPGAVSQLYYADRLYELPLAIVGIALGVVLLPEVSRHLAIGNVSAAVQAQNRSAELAMLLTVPAAVALIVIPGPIVSLLFERGAFTRADTVATSLALAIFAAGLPSFVLIKVFSPAYFARHDTRTPMLYAGISLTANTIGSVALFFLLRSYGLLPQLGIAAATTLSGWLNAYLLWRRLAVRGEFMADQRLLRALPTVLLASAAMGLVLVLVGYYGVNELLRDKSLLNRAAGVGLLVGAGCLSYAIAIFGSGLVRVSDLRRR
jgi:putative peptidoglycan lipid II flippase